MEKLYSWLALAYFVAATLMLMVLSVLLLVIAVYQTGEAFFAGEPFPALLDAIGIIIIGFAVVETAKFIAEEEVVRRRELRSSLESRRSITKFITIIVIAASLEALVMVFKANDRGIEYAVYPAVLFFVATFALVALGAYQWLSSRIERPEATVPSEEAEGVYPADKPSDEEEDSSRG